MPAGDGAAASLKLKPANESLIMRMSRLSVG
jgi:hypothetical protein